MSGREIALKILKILEEVDETSRGHLVSAQWPSKQLYPCFNLFIGTKSESYEKLQRQLVEGFVKHHGTGRDVNAIATITQTTEEGGETVWITLYGERRADEGESSSSAMVLVPSGEWRMQSLEEVGTVASVPPEST